MVGYVIYNILYTIYIHWILDFINKRLLTMICASFQKLIENIDYLIELYSSRNVE